VNKLLEDKMTLGADASIAAGPVGRGIGRHGCSSDCGTPRVLAGPGRLRRHQSLGWCPPSGQGCEPGRVRSIRRGSRCAAQKRCQGTGGGAGVLTLRTPDHLTRRGTEDAPAPNGSRMHILRKSIDGWLPDEPIERTGCLSNGEFDARTSHDQKTDPEKRLRRVLSASTLAGDRVKNSAGEDLGNVHEIMIDISSGTVAYAVLSFGGFLGMGDKLCALPWGALTLDEDEIALELQNISRPCSTASAGVSRSSHEVGALERPFDVDRF
jgi:hypothetical protein